MTDTVAPEPTPKQAALFARVRRLMLIAGLTTTLAVKRLAGEFHLNNSEANETDWKNVK